MTVVSRFRPPLLIAGLLLACTGSSRSAPEGRRAIEDTVARYVHASNAGDADALADLYTDDAVLLPPDHQPIRGREAIRTYWRQGTDEGLAVTTLVMEVDGVVGYLVGQYTLPATDAEPADSGKYVMCLQRQGDGSWKLAADIWNGSADTEGSEAGRERSAVPIT